MNRSSIRRRVEDTWGRGAMLQLSMTARQATPDALAAAVAATSAAATEADARAGRVVSLAVTSAPRGPVITIDAIDTATLDSWLGDLAEGLETAGVTGTLRAAPKIWPTDDRFVHPTERRGLLFPTAVAAFRLAHYPRVDSPDRLRFMVEPSTTASLSARFSAWAHRLPGGQTYASTGATSTQLAPEGSADWLTAVAGHTQFYTELSCSVADQPRERRLTLNVLGQAVVWAAEGGRPWAKAVADLRAWLLADPAALDQAHIRNGTIAISGFNDLQYEMNTPGHTTPPHSTHTFMENRHLWDRHVIDAAGFQVLTRKHLDHAHDVSGWRTTALGSDRYLMEAHDLAPWFTDPLDPAVLDAAREDFGDMLLTRQHTIDNPGPYTRAL